jgi:hypothetical protein
MTLSTRCKERVLEIGRENLGIGLGRLVDGKGGANGELLAKNRVTWPNCF